MKRLGTLHKVLKPRAKRVTQPARTRFAPSPTGVIHLGSLRTALYNFLLAKATGGQFLLRLEDTDQKRLVQGAEKNIYESLEWAGLKWDEGPFRQSEREEIYEKYTQQLLESNQAYRCFCDHDRLDHLAKTAREMHHPSTASYDRKCSHLSKEESDKRAKSESFVVRFKSPIRTDGSGAPNYPSFKDVLHGELTIQPQINQSSPRFDDFVIMKSDKLPTYHMANVIDDHLMGITHVVRGEEWLPSTPKHVALYDSFGWSPPQFIHIPLLMGEGGKKLSKRKSALGVLEFKDTILPEAFVNFVALLGWSPAAKRVGTSMNEVMDMGQLVANFSLEGLTKGNVQVDMNKLKYFDQEFFKSVIKSDPNRISELCELHLPYSKENISKYVKVLQNHVTSVPQLCEMIQAILATPEEITELNSSDRAIINEVYSALENGNDPLALNYPKKKLLPLLRNVLVSGKSGMSISEIFQVLGDQESLRRLQRYI